MKWLSYSQLETWQRCPAKWNMRHQLHLKPKRYQLALDVGSKWHALVQAWWQRLPTEPVLDAWTKEAQAAMTSEEYEAWKLATFDLIVWLFERYTRWYAGQREESRVLGVEVGFKLPLPHPAGKKPIYGIIGFLDLILLHIPTKTLWLREFKTAAQFGREELVHVDPQLTTYAWAAREVGLGLHGIQMDVAKKYRWKRDERDPSESFRLVPIDRTDEQLDVFAAKTHELIAQIEYARKKSQFPLNVVTGAQGACTSCSFMDVCIDRLSGRDDDADYILSTEFTGGKR